MIKTTILWEIVLTVIPFLVPAKDFPLEFKAIKAEDLKGSRWSYGAVQMMVAEKPATLKKEPKAVSAHPLYGQFEYRADKTSMLFRLDESEGTSKGYDRLILDLNQNGDLADDAVITPTTGIERWSSFQGQELTMFGPIEAPASKWIGLGKPVYYAVLDVRTNAIAQLRKNPAAATNVYFGNLRFRAGWYLEAAVEMEGGKRTMGIIDNNANMRLGDLCQPYITSYGQWFLGAADGDRLLLMKDDSGTNNEHQLFTQIFYFDAAPCKIGITEDCRSLQVEPWPEPLAEVSLQPHGEQVEDVSLVWESTTSPWQIFDVHVAGGKIKVPPGNYGLYGVDLSAKSQNGVEITAYGADRDTNQVLSAVAGGTNTLICGAPLKIEVTTERQGKRLNWFAKLFSAGTGELLIQARIVGAGGETYMGFDLSGERGQRQPPRPAFTIATADGKQVASGNLEFG